MNMTITNSLKALQAFMLALALVTMSFPVTALTARAEDGEQTPAVVEETPATLDCEAGTHEEDGVCVADEVTPDPLECTDGKVLNETGDECVDPTPAPIEEPESTPEVAGRFTQTNNNQNDDHKVNICHNGNVINVDENGWNGHNHHKKDFLVENEEDVAECEGSDDPYEDNTDNDMCVIVSDTLTQQGGEDASLVSFLHDRWTAAISLAAWIWGEDPIALSAGDEVETFTRTFSVDEDPTTATLEVAADNTYTVSINGVAWTEGDGESDPNNYNYQSTGQDTYNIPDGVLVEGENTIEFTVTNKHLSGENAESNPAGLLYKLTVDGADCGEPDVVENSCLAPTAEGASEHITVNGAPGSEDDLADLIGSSDVDDDQVNFQTWDATGNDVDFVVTYHGKKANSGDKHLFGWFNGSTFTPVFRDANTGNVTYDALPLVNTEGATASFSVTGMTDISFGIYNVSSGKYYSTDKTNAANGDSADHAVVYNPSADEYTIGFEDLLNGGDHDFEDVVVTLTTECSPTQEDGINVVAYKVVCDDESYLPNWGNGGPNITADTAEDFVNDTNEEAEDEVCHLVRDWEFEWGNSSAPDMGKDFYGPSENEEYHVFEAGALTNIPFSMLNEGNEVHLREVLQDGYIPFTYGPDHQQNDNNVSAEFYCSDDVLNYDNWDYIRNPEEGETYYCVAFNAEKEKAPVCDPEVNLVANGSFEDPEVTNGAGWDIFNVGTTPSLVWLADFLDAGAPAGGNVEIQEGVGWAASDGDQYTELDSDWGGPSSDQTGEAGAVEISQDLTTVPGQKYHVSYDFSARPGTAATQNSVNVSINGSSMHITSAGSPTAGNQTEWSTDGFDFTAGGVLTTLALRDAGTPNDSLGTLIDNVKVTCVPDETPTCDDDEHLEDGQCVPNEPTCDEGEELVDGQCVPTDGGDDEVDVCPNIDGFQSEVPEGKKIRDGQCLSSKNRSGGSGGNSGGQVLGATTCGPLLTQYLKLGWANDPEEVKKLQDFLNTQLGLGLPVTGFFGNATFDAVKAFQLAHAKDVLVPWVGLPASGITGENTPTGFVYQTTRWEINNIWCPGSEAFPAVLN